MHMPAPQTLAMPPPPHVSLDGQAAPHSRVPPHPSLVEPQFAPAGHAVIGVQVVTHWPVIPLAPHVWLAEQLPQLRTLPQPSSCIPHMKPCAAQSPLYAAQCDPASPPPLVLDEVVNVVTEPPVELDVTPAPPLPALAVGFPDAVPVAPPLLLPLPEVWFPALLHAATATTTAATHVKRTKDERIVRA
jgi:hypothetical protein